MFNRQTMNISTEQHHTSRRATMALERHAAPKVHGLAGPRWRKRVSRQRYSVFGFL